MVGQSEIASCGLYFWNGVDNRSERHSYDRIGRKQNTRQMFRENPTCRDATLGKISKIALVKETFVQEISRRSLNIVEIKLEPGNYVRHRGQPTLQRPRYPQNQQGSSSGTYSSTQV
ncbi:hypothetical protein JTB14_017232 [Gonioctena quinquepunctata]|nr:hypothetical protein JTB14_017232 [Gonioctena quinquepunctata]